MIIRAFKYILSPGCMFWAAMGGAMGNLVLASLNTDRFTSYMLFAFGFMALAWLWQRLDKKDKEK